MYNSLAVNLRTNDNLLIDMNSAQKFVYNSLIENYILENLWFSGISSLIACILNQFLS